LNEYGLVRLAAQAVQPSQNIVAYRPWSGRYAPCFSPTSRLALSATGGASATLPAFSDSLLHCGTAIGNLLIGFYQVACFTFLELA